MKLDDINLCALSCEELEALLSDLKEYIYCREKARLLATDLNNFLFEKFGGNVHPDELVSTLQKGVLSQERKKRPPLISVKEGRSKASKVCAYSSLQGRTSFPNGQYLIAPVTEKSVFDTIKYLRFHPEVDTEGDADELEGELKKGSENWNLSYVRKILDNLRKRNVGGSNERFHYTLDECGCVKLY